MQGYNATAGWMGTYSGLCIFRRFLILNARNLLCMQAEILNLDHVLRVTIKEDRNAKDSPRSQFEYDISAMKGPHATPGDGLQWQQVLELRGLLKQYGLLFPSLIALGILLISLPLRSRRRSPSTCCSMSACACEQA
jgi:hypothetical protein